MNEQHDSKSASGAKTALQGGLARLSEIQFLALLRGQWTGFMRWLTGVDADVLAQCSKSQQTLYSAIGIVMLLAALLTAAGLSAKLAGLWELGMVGRLGLFVMLATLVLALEAAVLSSISPDAKPWTTLAVRVPIGLLLVSMQVVPTLTTMLQSQIELSLAKQGLQEQVELQVTSQKLRNVEGLRYDGKSLDDKLLRAIAEQQTPPADNAVAQAQANLAQASESFKKATLKALASRKRVNELTASLAKAKDDRAAARVQVALDNAKVALSKANAEANTADVAIQTAENEVKSAKAAQATALSAAVSDAKQKVTGHSETMAKTQENLDSDAEKAKKLADKATQANFITQVVALGKLAKNDGFILVTCLVAIFGFALLDLLPTMLKMSARNGLYARLVQIQDAEMRAVSETEHYSAEQDRLQRSVIKANQTAGVRQFIEIDKGKLEGQRLLLVAQQAVDELQTTATIDLAQTALDRLATLLHTLIEQSAKLAEYPDVAPTYRQHLDRLLQEMQERANAIAEQLRGGQTAPQGT
jgi:Domain of unknown function (DUF4407)